ncbi:MAG: PQQ-binding-like beta-propeller repeat protein, partial [Planctomycetota bacterium]
MNRPPLSSSRALPQAPRALAQGLARGFVSAALLLALHANARASEIQTAWTSLRGDPQGQAACRWEGKESPPPIREWHFTSKGARRYTPGLAVWASPALALVGGRPMAFIGGYDRTLHALDLADKEERWSKITGGPIGAAPAVGLVAGKPVVFWGSSDRFVYAAEARTGRRLWTRELVEPTSTLAPADLSSPLLHDG